MFVGEWAELLSEVHDVEAPSDVTPYVMARISAAQSQRGRVTSDGGPSVRARLSALPLGWLAAAVGCVLVLGVLAVAAHSRREAPASDAPVVSAAKLSVLRGSFAPHPFYRRNPTLADASATVQFGLIRPRSTLASDANLDSVWTSKTRQAALIWKSGVTETISRWACRCDPASSLKKMAKTLPPFRYLTIGGSPAVVAPSAPEKRDIIGILSQAQAKYGQPASVQVVRDGLSITLYQYGRHVLPGLIATAHTLVGDSTNPRTGLLVGSLVTEGGVSLPTSGSDITPVQDAPILVTGTTTAGRHIQRGPTTDQAGRFTIQLPAGTYKIENGIYLNVTGSAVVVAGETSHVRLIVHVQ
jgi:hypothetical protein